MGLSSLRWVLMTQTRPQGRRPCDQCLPDLRFSQGSSGVPATLVRYDRQGAADAYPEPPSCGKTGPFGASQKTFVPWSIGGSGSRRVSGSAEHTSSATSLRSANASNSPASHTRDSPGPSTRGIRPWMGATQRFGAVVTMENRPSCASPASKNTPPPGTVNRHSRRVRLPWRSWPPGVSAPASAPAPAPARVSGASCRCAPARRRSRAGC